MTDRTIMENKKTFKAEVQGKTQESQYFDTLPQAKSWLKEQGGGSIKECRFVEWSFPIDRKVQLPTWVQVK